MLQNFCDVKKITAKRQKKPGEKISIFLNKNKDISIREFTIFTQLLISSYVYRLSPGRFAAAYMLTVNGKKAGGEISAPIVLICPYTSIFSIPTV